MCSYFNLKLETVLRQNQGFLKFQAIVQFGLLYLSIL
jgi:hypothetical protein